MALITLLTDFGPGRYVAAMKGVVLSINPQATVVDLEHDITPQNVVEGAFILASAVRYFPEAVHVGVVDPGVGTERRAMVLACKRGTLVGPDNGLLLPAAHALGLQSAYEITAEEYCLPEVSDTFHGRDIFAPVAGHLSRGAAPDTVGPLAEDLVELDFGSYEATDRELRGRILFPDRFGNLITNVPREALPSWLAWGRRVRLELESVHELPFLKRYAQEEPGRPILTVSSDGYLEIAVNQGSAAIALEAHGGATFVLRPA